MVDFGWLIKRSWQITWRYKALWVLAIFAGISGCQPGGGGGGGGGNYVSGDSSFFGGGATPATPDQWTREIGRLFDRIETWLPALFAVGVLFFFVGLLWMILGIAARGGLVTGVDAAERDTRLSAGQMWSAGFSRFFSLLGVDILLMLPIVIATIVFILGLVLPVIGIVSQGSDPGPGLIAPICGSLAIGVPVLIVLSFVLGIMHPLAIRYVMLGGQGAFTASGNAWRFLRARFKDTLLMWLLSGALNLAASLVLAVPIVVVGIGFGIAIAGAAYSMEWGVTAGLAGALVLVSLVLGLIYSAIWGTFTSALWTLFFRKVTGMDAGTAGVAAATGPVPAGPAEPAGPLPVQPMPPAPPSAPAPPGPPGPPIATPPAPPAEPGPPYTPPPTPPAEPE